MPTSQTREALEKALEKQLCKTKELVQDYEECADAYVWWHRLVGICLLSEAVLLFLEVIVEIVILELGWISSLRKTIEE